MVNCENKPVPNWWYHPAGVAQYLDDERKEIILEVAEYLEEHCSHYGRGTIIFVNWLGMWHFPGHLRPKSNFF